MSTTAQRLRPSPITQDRFERLPALIHLGEFVEFSGIDRRKVTTYVEAGVIRSHSDPAGRRLFYKADLAKVAGFKCDIPYCDPAHALGRLVQLLEELDTVGLENAIRQLAALRSKCSQTGATRG